MKTYSKYVATKLPII